MATLTKVKSDLGAISALASSVPTPFPRDILVINSSAVDTSTSSQEQQPQLQESEAGPSNISEVRERSQNGQQTDSLHELMPSIVHVERACIMALNNLLSLPLRWKTIVPDRRHSMPNSPRSSSPQAVEESSSSALHTLVSNLRTRGTGEMIQASPSESDADLIQELHVRVDEISSSLDSSDAILVKTLIALLSHLHRLSILVNPSSPKPIASFWNAADSDESLNLFDALKRQLSDFQLERSTSQQDVVPRGSKPVLTVEAALLWSKIDQELDTVVSMCKERTEYLSYDPPDYEYDTLPVYDHDSRSSMEDFDQPKLRAEVSSSSVIPGGQMSEKRKLDLEAVTMAIDRLYLVAPQLHNQRVELKSTKLAQMEKARRQGSQSATSSRSAGKQKEQDRDIKDLENMLELINKASGRTLKDQSVILDGGMQARLEKVRQRDMAKREAFVDQLAEHSNAGRLHDQDALLQIKIKDPDAMLSLPEFIREAVPVDSLKIQNPKALLTLPEFIKEVPPSHIISSRSTSALPTPAPAGGAFARLKSKSKNRDRSMSAPPLAWLRSSSSKSNLQESQSKSNEDASAPQLLFEVTYVAEFHENLHHVLVFFTVTGAQPGVDLEAEVVPSFSNNQSDDGDRLIIKSGSKSSLPLLLPARVVPGKQEIKVQSNHFEIKLAALTSSPSPSESGPLLDATQLSNSNPTSFICSMCSLQLIQSSTIHYRDLPSEHWEELVDAWMCHSSQTLNENVVKNGRGFWPDTDQALVGGSYILFEDSAMVKDNLHPDSFKGDNHHLVRCLCGSVLGRCQEHPTDSTKVMAYKILKYAVRPVSASSEPLRIPLSAFIVEDMVEFVHAHASYRFIISDEEDERPRILIWLFKPNLQLAYTTSKHYAIPRSGSMNAAKVLYKLMGPSEGNMDLQNILEKYPGFPQAEYLFYPMDTCQRLAVLLKESNRTYPDHMRIMTGLEVGWLQRA